jgi:hypothetical protein
MCGIFFHGGFFYLLVIIVCQEFINIGSLILDFFEALHSLELL